MALREKFDELGEVKGLTNAEKGWWNNTIVTTMHHAITLVRRGVAAADIGAKRICSL